MTTKPPRENSRRLMLLARFAAVTLCLAAGFVVARALMPPAPPRRITITKPQGEAAPAAPRAAAADTREGTLIAEWEQMRAQHGNGGAEFPRFYAEVMEIKDSFRRRAFRAALLAEWAATDPQAGIAFLREKDRSQVVQLMREWLQLDPQAAVNGLLSGGKQKNNDWYQLLPEIARLAPTRLAEVVSQAEGQVSGGNATAENAFAILVSKDLESARVAAESVTGPFRGQALAGVAKAWAETDGAAALAWAQALPPGEARDVALKGVLVGWAKSDPVAALAKIDLVPPDAQRMLYASDVGAKVLREAAKKDWDGTLRWLREHPGKLGSDSLGGLEGTISQRLEEDPAGTLRAIQESELPGLHNALSKSMLNEGYAQRDAIWKWLEEQPPSGFTKSVRSMLLDAMGWKEPDAALAYLEKLPDSPENLALLEQGARSMIFQGGAQKDNVSRRKNNVEELLAKASGKLRPFLIEAGLIRPIIRSASDPAKWVARLNELPPERRVNGIGGLARGWAANDPQGATQWALSIEEPQQRMQAIGAATSSWATADRYETAEWINSLPAGADRDTAAVSLVGALGQSEPETAWTWALSMQTPQQRQNALQLAVTMLQKKDPAFARQMVLGAHLPAAESKALLQHFGQ